MNELAHLSKFVLNLPAKITHNDAEALARKLIGQVSAQPDVVMVGAQHLIEFDSSALAVLLACRRAAWAAGKQFSINSLPDKLAQLAGLYGVAQLLVPPVASELS